MNIFKKILGLTTAYLFGALICYLCALSDDDIKEKVFYGLVFPLVLVFFVGIVLCLIRFLEWCFKD
jgi:hypothetical protein